MQKIVRILHILIGALFVISGFIKVNDTLGFAYKLDEYFEVFDARWGMGFEHLTNISIPLSIILSVFEVLLGFAFLFAYRISIASWLMLIIIVFFSFLTGFSAITESVTDCGCFGDAIKLTPWESFSKDIVLLVMILPVFFYREKLKPITGKLTLPLMAVFSIITLIFTWFTYHYLPVIDFRAYQEAADFKHITTTFREDGSGMIGGDYVSMSFTCGEDETKGNTLLVISSLMEKADLDDLKYSQKINSELQKSNASVKVMGGTASLSEDKDKLIKEAGIKYCMTSQDLITMKTIIRSNPGYLLLKDGIIVGKWSCNNAPDTEEIQALLK